MSASPPFQPSGVNRSKASRGCVLAAGAVVELISGEVVMAGAFYRNAPPKANRVGAYSDALPACSFNEAGALRPAADRHHPDR